VSFPVLMTDGAWDDFMGLDEPTYSRAIELLADLTQGPNAVEGARADDFGRYNIVIGDSCLVAFSLTAGERPGIADVPDGPYVHVWPPLPWIEP